MEGVGAPRGGCAGGAPSAGGAGEGLALVPLAEGAPDQAIPSASGCCHFRNRGVAARLVSTRPARAPSAPMPQVLARAEASALEHRQALASDTSTDKPRPGIIKWCDTSFRCPISETRGLHTTVNILRLRFRFTSFEQHCRLLSFDKPPYRQVNPMPMTANRRRLAPTTIPLIP